MIDFVVDARYVHAGMTSILDACPRLRRGQATSMPGMANFFFS